MPSEAETAGARRRFLTDLELGEDLGRAQMGDDPGSRQLIYMADEIGS
eukprot:CAMPEP_0183366986 /NCGR_PEP_ID=MMETSP0164_2-20130417/90880_1 /TAXON_ID=221442 /ORGANISM="Coccolithus pelagicus ssp braarudi, Strain PLY182g" /LENGTH=47 /DNA_ID= /DNA_START= /DNA_END= /DNA_ORIENTATION=